MKTKNLLPALIAGLALLPAGRVIAQSFTTLHSFTALIPYYANVYDFTALSGSYPNYTNSDGASLPRLLQESQTPRPGEIDEEWRAFFAALS